MSTPAIITFSDDEGSFAIYQHYDGNPQGVALALHRAKQYAWPLPRFEAAEFAAAYIRANKDHAGGIYFGCGNDGDDYAFSYIVTPQAGQLALSINKPGRLFSYTYLLPDSGVDVLRLLRIETSLVSNQMLAPQGEAA